MAGEIITPENLNRAIDEAERLFVDAGQHQIRAEAMDMRRKRVRAALLIKHKAEAKSVALAEAMAEADPVYELACADWESAAMQAVTMKAQAEAKRMKFEAWRTANATARAQMNLR